MIRSWFAHDNNMNTAEFSCFVCDGCFRENSVFKTFLFPDGKKEHYCKSCYRASMFKRERNK